MLKYFRVSANVRSTLAPRRSNEHKPYYLFTFCIDWLKCCMSLVFAFMDSTSTLFSACHVGVKICTYCKCIYFFFQWIVPSDRTTEKRNNGPKLYTNIYVNINHFPLKPQYDLQRTFSELWCQWKSVLRCGTIHKFMQSWLPRSMIKDQQKLEIG